MANFYVGEVLFETGGTIDTPGDITVTSILDCAGSTGTTGQILSSTGTALEWIVAPSGGSGIPCSVITAKGDIVVGTAAGTPAALPVGTFNQVLLADSGCATGLKWGGLPTASVTGLGVMYGCVTNAAPNNTSVGYFTLPYSSTTCTIAIGNNSMIGATGDSHIAIGIGVAGPTGATGCNVFIGNRIGCGNAQNTTNNVIIGQYAVCDGLNGSSRNVILGANAATTLSEAHNNVVIGYGVAPPTTTSDCTLAIGYCTGCHWLTGDSTKAIKPGAGIIDCANSCGTAGQVLASDGNNAICWITPGGASAATPTVAGVVLGCTAGSISALGCNALVANTTGANNVAMGISALACNTTGINNTALGWYALGLSTITSDNTAVGGQAGSGAIGDDNTFIGREAGAGVTGSGNTFLGWNTGKDQVTGDYNLALGYAVDVDNVNGSCQLAIGFSATDNWLTGDSTKAIKPGAGIIDCAGSCGTTGQVLSSVGNAVCWITPAGASAATPTARGTVYGCTTDAHPVSGSGDVALGLNAYAAVTTGYSNAAIGGDALAGLTSGCNNIGIGDQAGFAITTESDNVIIGANSVLNCAPSKSVVVGSGVDFVFGNTENVIVGHSAATNGSTGTAVSCSVILGGCALTSTTQVGDNLIAIGHAIALPNSNGSTQLAIGNGSTYWLSGDSNYAIKPGGGIIDCTGSCGFSGQYLTTTGSNDICWNYIPYATPTAAGIVYGMYQYLDNGPYALCGNVGYGPDAMGCVVAGGNTNSARNTGIGLKALANAGAAGDFSADNTAVGLCALACSSGVYRSTAVGSYAGMNGGNHGVFVGWCAGFSSQGLGNIMIGAVAGCCVTSGNSNTAVGYYSLRCATTTENTTVLGSYAGYNSTGSCNTFIGTEAGCLNTTSNNVIAIGYAANSSSATVCNEITLGNSAITCIRANVQTISSLSDARDKKNATALPVGLNLIRELKPVQFTWDQRDGNRVGDLDTGFLAQDLDAAQCAVGYEVPGLVNKDNPDRYEASYGKLLPVLVKAIQELNEELTTLKQEFNDYRSTHP